AGLAWLPQTLVIIVVSNIGARIATKLGARTLIALGTLVLGAGMLLFLRTTPESDYVTVLLPPMLVTGVGVGLAFVSVTMAATAGVPDRDQGIASGLIGTAQQVGMAVGLAILVNSDGSGRCRSEAVREVIVEMAGRGRRGELVAEAQRLGVGREIVRRRLTERV